MTYIAVQPQTCINKMCTIQLIQKIWSYTISTTYSTRIFLLSNWICLGTNLNQLSFYCTNQRSQQNIDFILNQRISKVFLESWLDILCMFNHDNLTKPAKYGFYWRHYWWRKLVISVKLLLSNIIYNKRDESCRFHSVVIGLLGS